MSVKRASVSLRRGSRLGCWYEKMGRLDATCEVTHVVHVNGTPLTGKIRTAWEGARRDAGCRAWFRRRSPYFAAHVGWIGQRRKLRPVRGLSKSNVEEQGNRARPQISVH